MIAQARRVHPTLTFLEADALDLSVEDKFDFVILSDLVNDLWDVQQVFERLRNLCTPRTRIILNFYSRLWEWPRAIATKAGAANAILRQNWMTVEDVTNLL